MTSTPRQPAIGQTSPLLAFLATPQGARALVPLGNIYGAALRRSPWATGVATGIAIGLLIAARGGSVQCP